MDNFLSKYSNQVTKAALFFVFFMTILSVSTAFASGSPTPSPEFNQTVTDLSNRHANEDYGQQIINWIAFGKPDNVKFGETSLLSTISFTLNAIALVMMAYLSLLGGLTYVIQTANKGTPGGQVVSSFWMPIRIATATILLVPLASGYSTIQYGVITVAEKGSAHGSYLMDQGIDYIAEHGIYRPPVMESSKEVVVGMLWSELCMSHINTTEKSDSAIVINKRVDFISIANETLEYSYDKPAPENTIAKNGYIGYFIKKLTTSDKKGYCGTITLLTPDADVDSFLDNSTHETTFRLFATADYEDDAGVLATEKLVAYLEGEVRPRVQAIAAKLNADGKALAALQNQGGEAAQSTYERNQAGADKAAKGVAGELNDLITDYDNNMHKILQETVMAVNKHNTTSGGFTGTTNAESSGTAPWVKQIKSVGWPALGTVFWQISKNQEALNYLAKRMKATYTEPAIDEEYQGDERYLTLYSRLSDLIRESQSIKKTPARHVFDMSTIEMAGADGSAGYLKSKIAGATQSLMLAMFIPDDDGDLITKLQYSGSVLTSITDLMIHASIFGKAAGNTAVATADQIARAAATSGASVPLVGALTGAAAAAGAQILATPATFAGHLAVSYMDYLGTLVVPLILAGFALAVVLPAIPLFFWLMGVVSWMMFFVECLLISPMWLAAHGTAEKDGWGSEHTRQGYMLMIGLYLNPILRVAGFFAIFLVLIPLGRMVGWLSDYLTGVMSSGWLSPVMLIGAMVILSVFAYSAAVRVFSLPNELFERGLRWVNGGQEVTGDSSAEQQNRTIIASVGGKAEGAASAARHLGRSQAGPSQPKPTDNNTPPST